MKKLAVLVVLFLGGMTAQAHVTNLDHGKERGIRYTNSQPITFVQKGITFFVYGNGDFNFTRTQYNSPRRFGHNAPGTTYGVSFPNRNRDLILYDRWGNISKVGRNFINYNRKGRVNQIGNVTLRYHRGQLVRVGNMNIIYNRRGQIAGTEGTIFTRNRDRYRTNDRSRISARKQTRNRFNNNRDDY